MDWQHAVIASYSTIKSGRDGDAMGEGGEGVGRGAATVHYNVVKILDYGGWGCGWELNQLI